MTDSKRLVELAEKELKEKKERKQIKLIKSAIKQTLEKIEDKTNEKKELEKEIKILKQDIDNIRAGRLDLIEERQKKDERAKNTSVIIIERGKTIKNPYPYSVPTPWYEPYKIYPNPAYPWRDPVWTIDDTTAIPNDDMSYTICNSIARNAVAGTYKLKSGTIKSIS